MTTAPPLIALDTGKKPRPTRVRIPLPKELTLHLLVAKLLREHALPDWQWTHVPSGELRDIRTAVKLKAMGMRKGWPDFILISPHGSVRCLELKRDGESLTDEQDDFRIWCISHCVPFATASTIDQVLATLDSWRVLRIEITERATP